MLRTPPTLAVRVAQKILYISNPASCQRVKASWNLFEITMVSRLQSMARALRSISYFISESFPKQLHQGLCGLLRLSFIFKFYACTRTMLAISSN